MNSTQGNLKLSFYLYWTNISVKQYTSETNKYHHMIKNACDYKTIFHNTQDSTTVERVQDAIRTRTLSRAASCWSSTHVSKRSPGKLCHGHFGSQQYQKPCIAIPQNTGALHAPATFWATACSFPQGFACTPCIFYFDHEYRPSYYLESIYDILGLV